MPLPDLDILVAVAEAGTLTGAAEAVGLPRPTLSRRLAKLEQEVGAVLVHRNSRQVALTDAGQELYRHARPIVDAVRTASDAIRARDAVPRGLLRVSVPDATGLLSEMLCGFAVAHPQVRVEVSANARHVNLVAEGYDVALRAGHLSGPSLISRKLQTNRTAAYASPAYLERRGTPADAGSLIEHDCLVGFERGEVPQRHWPLRSGGRAPVSVRMASNTPAVLKHAATMGLGIALLPEVFVPSEVLEQRMLVPVLPDAVGSTGGIWLVFPERRLMLPRVRAFIDHTVGWFDDHPLARP